MFKSNTLDEPAPYRIERTKFGIEICSLQENAENGEEEVKDQSLNPHL